MFTLYTNRSNATCIGLPYVFESNNCKASNNLTLQIGANWSRSSVSHFRRIMGGVLGKNESPLSPKASVPETKLEAKITEAMLRRETEGSSIKSFDSLVLKFPKIDENLRKCKVIFQEFGKLAAHPLSNFYSYLFGNIYLH